MHPVEAHLFPSTCPRIQPQQSLHQLKSNFHVHSPQEPSGSKKCQTCPPYISILYTIYKHVIVFLCINLSRGGAPGVTQVADGLSPLRWGDLGLRGRPASWLCLFERMPFAWDSSTFWRLVWGQPLTPWNATNRLCSTALPCLAGPAITTMGEPFAPFHWVGRPAPFQQLRATGCHPFGVSQARMKDDVHPWGFSPEFSRGSPGSRFPLWLFLFFGGSGVVCVCDVFYFHGSRNFTVPGGPTR